MYLVSEKELITPALKQCSAFINYRTPLPKKMFTGFFFYRQNWNNRRSDLSEEQRASLFASSAREAREAEDPSGTPNLSKQGGSSGSGTTRTLGISQNSYRLHQMQEHQAMMMMCARTHIEGGRVYLLAK